MMQRKQTLHPGPLVAVALALLLLGATPLSAQVNMTGTWTFTVDVDGAISNPEMVLAQSGMTLTGRYISAQLGEADVMGTVERTRVTVTFEADLGGQVLPGEYAGTVDAAGVWTGTFDLSGLVSGTFSAIKN